MGMLGAMAGMGQGLQDFSTLLNEKSKMDWMAQQEAVKHERQLSLENLRASREDARWNDQKGFALQERQANQEFTIAQNQEQNKLKLLQYEIEKKDALARDEENAKRAMALEDRRAGNQLAEIGARKGAEFDLAVKVYNKGKEWKKEEQDKLFADIESREDLTPTQKDFFKASIKNKEILNATGLGGKEGLSDTVIVKYMDNYVKGQEKFDLLSKDDKETVYAGYQKADPKVDPRKVRDMFSADFAYNSMPEPAQDKMSRGGMLKGQPMDVSSDSTSALNMKAVNSVIADLNKGTLTEADVIADKSLKASEKDAIIKGFKASSAGVGSTPSKVVPEGRYDWGPGYGIRPYPKPAGFGIPEPAANQKYTMRKNVSGIVKEINREE